MSSLSRRHDGEGGGGLGSDKELSEMGSDEKGRFKYFGWVYHLYVNSLGHQYCKLRFLFVRGKYVEMYKRDPHDNSGIVPADILVLKTTIFVDLFRFVDGSDMFRDARLKLVPSIIEGYWMVKRAVGTKACLLGKAVTCNYFRKDNFFEIDVDIGSSSVARRIISLVLGYVISLVVDLAVIIEAKEEDKLPEYILGTVQINRVEVDSAVPFDV